MGKPQAPRTAAHRPAVRRRRFRHDDLVAVDLFSGFGGLTRGIEMAGFTTIMAANHNAYKVEIHEANHPHAEHWIADLVDPAAADYHSARDLPAADLLVAGVSCVNHSQANTRKAYEQGLSLFELEDPDFEARVTKSERDRATASCVLHYAAQHHPRMILVECTTELASWGPALPGRPKVGDGSTYRWWLKQFELLNYQHKVLYLNSMHFGVPQSRDRGYWVFWDKSIPAPDLEFRPVARCRHCDRDVESVWSWKTGLPATGSVRYGQQYEYRCTSCHRPVAPPATPSVAALDLSVLGTRIGDRTRPLAASTTARAQRCLQRFGEFPAVLMPAKGVHGSERPLGQPLPTQTSQQEAAILSTGTLAAGPRHAGATQSATADGEKALLLAIDNFQGGPRGANEPFPTQGGSETMGLLSAEAQLLRAEALPPAPAEAMQLPGLLLSDWYKRNGSTGNETAPHPLTDPVGTLTTHDTTALLTARWRAALSELSLEDCYFRMLREYEIGRGCGFDVDFPGYQGSFIVWGSARNQTDGFGNAVSPQVGAWIGSRLRAALHRA
ncbi:DNA cytosine methyltransferase [Kitasatospora sp. NPDC001540]|uniref:DNA cytosine methyltransferase n=1 Tax=Kitasatospora sp. NPDC001540 TaxID=3364014 RepID=UPI00368AEE43